MTVPVTEQDLREAMRDRRYWQPGHPERQASSDWVTTGWQGLYPADGAARPMVWVRPYRRDGHPVEGHWRSAPMRDGGRGADDWPVRQVGWLSAILRSRLRRGPADGRGSGGPRTGGRQPIRDRGQRTYGSDGRDRVLELRGDPETRFDRIPKRDIDHWYRPGGEAGRARDLDRLRPIGERTEIGPGAFSHRLEDGRLATIRPSTGPGSDGVATLEIAEPRGSGRFVATDKFRYPVGR